MNQYPFECSIIIPVCGKSHLTAACLVAIAEHTPDCFEVIIVDNASADDTPQLLAQLDGDVTVITNDENLGFSHACNQGAAAARGRHIVFLNNDTEPQPGWLEALLANADGTSDIGVVGSKLLFPDGTIQHAGVVAVHNKMIDQITPVHQFYGGAAQQPEVNTRRPVTAVTAACMLVTRPCWEAAGPFDEQYWNGYEDVELCFMAGALGWHVVYEPSSVVVHHESQSGSERFRRNDENIARLRRRWAERMEADVVVGYNGVPVVRSLAATFSSIPPEDVRVAA